MVGRCSGCIASTTASTGDGDRRPAPPPAHSFSFVFATSSSSPFSGTVKRRSSPPPLCPSPFLPTAGGQNHWPTTVGSSWPPVGLQLASSWPPVGIDRLSSFRGEYLGCGSRTGASLVLPRMEFFTRDGGSSRDSGGLLGCPRSMTRLTPQGSQMTTTLVAQEKTKDQKTIDGECLLALTLLCGARCRSALGEGYRKRA